MKFNFSRNRKNKLGFVVAILSSLRFCNKKINLRRSDTQWLRGFRMTQAEVANPKPAIQPAIHWGAGC